MSYFVKNSIAEIRDILSYTIDEMSELESHLFRKELCQKFTNSKEHYPIWEHFSSFFSVRDNDAWMWLDEFIKQEEVYLFFDKTDFPIVYIFQAGQSIVRFLEEFPWDFYLSNKANDYILTHNDHDYLIATGTAETWLKKKALELSKTGWRDMDGKSYLHLELS